MEHYCLSRQIVDKLREYKIDAILEGKHGVYYDENILSEEVRRIKERHINEGFYKGQTFDDSDINFTDILSLHNLFKHATPLLKRG